MKKIIRNSAALILALIIVISFLFYWKFAGNCVTWLWPRDKFSAEHWQGAAYNQRYAFANDIIVSGKFIGMGRDEIIDALGFAESENIVSLVYTIQTYENGGCGFSSIASMRIEFDDDKKVKNVNVEFD